MTDKDDFLSFFATAAADAPSPAMEDPWDRVASASEAGAPIAGVLRERLSDGWRVDVFGLAGFLADDTLADPEAVERARAWQVGDPVEVRVLRFDRAGALRLWIPPE